MPECRVNAPSNSQLPRPTGEAESKGVDARESAAVDLRPPHLCAGATSPPPPPSQRPNRVERWEWELGIDGRARRPPGAHYNIRRATGAELEAA